MPRSTICIVTPDRREEWLRAVRSAVSQEVDGGLEVRVLHYGSTDGTHDAIAREFQDKGVERFESSQEVAVRRNQAAEHDSEFNKPASCCSDDRGFRPTASCCRSRTLSDLPRGEPVRQIAPDAGPLRLDDIDHQPPPLKDH